MKVNNKRTIATTGTRMLRWILGVSRRDHIRNEEIRHIFQLAPIDEVMHSGRLQSDGTDSTGTRRRGRPKKTCHLQIKDDMTYMGVTKDMALDRKEWRTMAMPTPRR